MSRAMDNSLNVGEKVLMVGRPTKGVLVRSWVLGIIFIWVIFIPFIIAIVRTVKLHHVELYVTNTRVRGRTGVIRIETVSIPLDKVESVGFKQRFWGRVFGFGHIVVRTASGQLVFSFMKDVQDLAKTINQQIDNYRTLSMRTLADFTAEAIDRVMIVQDA